VSEITRVPLERATREAIKALKRGGESYDAVIQHLLKEREKDAFKILKIAESYIYQPTDFEEYNGELREKGFTSRPPPMMKEATAR